MSHSKLLKVLYKLTEFCFVRVSVNRFGAEWISEPGFCTIVFDKCSFGKAI